MQTLYSDRERKWFFLIPDDITLMPGDFEIFTLTGQKQSVDARALEQFEVERDVAEAWVKEKVSGVITQAAEGLKSFIGKLRSDSEKKSKPPFTLDVLAALMDEEVEALKTDPEARKRGWEMLLSHAALVFGAPLSEDPNGLALAQTRMREIVVVLNEHGIPVSETIQELPQKLRQLVDSAKE